MNDPAYWPESLIDIPQPERDSWRLVDSGRYWEQIHQERHREAQISVDLEMARLAALRRMERRRRVRSFWREVLGHVARTGPFWRGSK